MSSRVQYYYDPYDFSDTTTEDMSYMQEDEPGGEAHNTDLADADSDFEMASASGRSDALSQPSTVLSKASLASFAKGAGTATSITSYTRETSSRSASPDSVVSMTDSLRTRMYREEYGRDLNNYSEIYRLPADAQEWSRLEKQHIMHIEMIGAKYPPPMEEVMRSTIPGEKKVLDLGCGSGAWIRDVARDFPHCEVVGVDLVPIRDASSLPPNARNEVDDINFGLQHFYGQFDVVHCRLIDSGIKDYRRLVDRIARVLRPGGLIELIEFDFRTYDKYGQVVPVSTEARLGPPWWARYLAHMRDAARASGGDTDAANHIEDWVKNCGAFENVSYHDFWSPVIPGDDNRYEDSVYAKMMDVIPAFLASGKPLLLGNGVTEEEFEILEQNTLRELHHSDVSQFTRMQCVYALKRHDVLLADDV